MGNLSYFFPNYIGNQFYGEDISASTSGQYLNMASDDQNP